MSVLNATVVTSVRFGDATWRRLRQAVRALAIAGWIGFGMLLFVVLRLLLPWRPVHGCLKPFMQPWMRITCLLIGVQISRAGGAAPAGMLVLANHISWLDIVVLAALQPVRFVAKAEVRDWPLIGLLAAAAGTLFLHRGKRAGAGSCDDVRQQLAAALAAGETVLIFPEGTTSDGSLLRRFHARLLPAGRAVQPAALRYRGRGANAVPFVGDDDFASSLWRIVAERDVHAHVQMLAPLAAADPDQLARQARRQISEALGLPRATSGEPLQALEVLAQQTFESAKPLNDLAEPDEPLRPTCCAG